MKKISSIFIVDDDPITVFGMRKMLESVIECGQINTLANGKLALDEIKERIQNGGPIPEVIFLDINMPIMDGWQFLEEFITLTIPNKVRINILTSSIDPVDIENWTTYNARTHHELTYNNKPLNRALISEITNAA